MRLIVTRPESQATRFVAALRALGVDAVALPLIAIDAIADRRPLAEAWSSLPARALAMFVSANAVEHFFAERHGAAWPSNTLAGSTGPGTSAALRERGLPEGNIAEPPQDAPNFDSESLWTSRLASRDWTSRSVLIVRGEDGRDWLADTLRSAGARVETLAAYRRGPPVFDGEQRALLDAAVAEPARHAWLISSSEALRRLAGLAPQADWSMSIAAASHPRIAESARAAGFGRVDAIAPTPAAAAAWAASLGPPAAR